MTLSNIISLVLRRWGTEGIEVDASPATSNEAGFHYAEATYALGCAQDLFDFADHPRTYRAASAEHRERVRGLSSKRARQRGERFLREAAIHAALTDQSKPIVHLSSYDDLTAQVH
jgi:hypothetical protein